eukprot:scpid36542/ scgid23730/ 
MRLLGIAALLCVACASLGLASPVFDGNSYSVTLKEHNADTVSGKLHRHGRTAVRFRLNKNDASGQRSLLLERGSGRDLLSANWAVDQDSGSLQVSRFNVMGTDFNTDLQDNVDEESEQRVFDRFRGSDEFKLLPVLSQLIGKGHNVTGYENSAALVLHRLALNSQKLHGTLDENFQPAKHRVKRCDLGLNPWSDCTSDTFACDSPKGRCSNDILDYTTPESCNYRGTPLTQSDYASGCFGMCGPGCYNCWTYICGDCCVHPGCTQHDGECSSYTSFDCLTAKGVLWGTGDSQYKDNC